MKAYAELPIKYVSNELAYIDHNTRMILFDKFGRRHWETEIYGRWIIGWDGFLGYLQYEGRLKEFYKIVLELTKNESISKNNI